LCELKIIKKSETDSRVTIAHGHLSGNVIFLSRFMEMPLCAQEQIYTRAKEAKADFTNGPLNARN